MAELNLAERAQMERESPESAIRAEAVWSALFDKASFVGDAMLQAAAPKLTNKVPVLGVSILARSISNLRAAKVLLAARQRLEARIIIRVLFENSLVFSAFEKDPDQVIDLLESDHNQSKRRRGDLLLKAKDSYTEDQMQIVRSILDQHKKGKYIKVDELAEIGGSSEYLRFYAQLSADSVHVSFDSLEEHILFNEDGSFAGVCISSESYDEKMSDTYSRVMIPFVSILDTAYRLYRNRKLAVIYSNFLDDYNKLAQDIS